MSEKIKVRQAWTYKHPRQVEALSVASESGDTVISDRRDTIIYFDANGDEVWRKQVKFSPLRVRITSDGSSVFILAFDGRLMRVNRNAELEWDLWVTKDVNNLAIKSKGQAAVVTSHKGRFHVISSTGERGRIVHTPEPVSSARISGRTGSLFAASPFGWVGLYDNRFNPLGEYNINMPVAELEVSEWGKRIFLPAREDGLNVIDNHGGRDRRSSWLGARARPYGDGVAAVISLKCHCEKRQRRGNPVGRSGIGADGLSASIGIATLPLVVRNDNVMRGSPCGACPERSRRAACGDN